ncbi:MAG: hypothetical protein HY201_04290 [Nitrospirae bacterium]|nr:hypothetical protein [Candidatus Troglogloeales bacterium]MBI3598649.1 hypothetical protein [Candidatus Troglogloeales bacterium]
MKSRKGHGKGVAVFGISFLLFTGLHQAWAGSDIKILQEGEGLNTNVAQQGDLIKADVTQSGISDVVDLNQIGSDISAVIAQEGSGDLIARVVGGVQVPFLQEGSLLSMYLSQKGDTNKILGAQIGSSMSLKAAQIGNGNKATLLQTGLGKVSGFSDSMSLHQEGDRNRVLKQFQRGAYLTGTIDQDGDKNTATQVLRGTKAAGVYGEIDQTGNKNIAIQCRKSGTSIINQVGNNLVNVSVNASCL